jgi:hypothetical protein
MVDLEMELHDSLENVTLAVTRMRDENDRMRAALLAAAEQFARYAGYHIAKNPPDQEKAATNVEWAARCREAATQAVS